MSWLAALLLPAALAAAAPPAGSREIAACIRDPGCHRTFVVAHRAEGFGPPEDSPAAVARAVAAGVPLVKIDVRASQDGQLFVLHDGRLEPRTSGRGRVETLPADRIERAVFPNGERVGRFADVYRISRDRAVLVVDFKAEVVEPLADWLAAHGSFDDVIFFVHTGEALRAAARARQRHPAMIVMVRLLEGRVTVESTRAVLGRLPEIFHTDRLDARAVAALQAQGVKVYVNALPLEQRPQAFADPVVDALVRTGVDFVLSARPVPLMRRLAASPAP